MVVGISDNWNSIRKSLMKDVHGFSTLPCRNQAFHRTNSLNSVQSLCSTNFSSEDDLPSEYLEGLPTVPDENVDEDWRLFGWLLDSADAVMSDTSLDLKTRPLTPLPPLEIPTEPLLPEASDLLKIKHRFRYNNAGRIPSSHKLPVDDYCDPQCRKRSFQSGDEDSETDEEDLFESRPMTRAMAHYLELKRLRKMGAPMPEEEPLEIKSEVDVHETYYYQDPIIKEEYSMDIDTSNNAEDFLPLDIKPDIRPKSKSKKAVVARAQILPGVKTTDSKRTKPGRPTNKEKRKHAKKTATELKKQKKDLAFYKDTYGIDIQDPVCSCRTTFDATRTYIRCQICSEWFHCRCVGISENKAIAGKVKQWHCASCAGPAIPEDDNDAYNDESGVEAPQYVCVCNTLFDPQSHYIGCNACTQWYHPECIGKTVEEINESQHYICAQCQGGIEHFTTDEFQHDIEEEYVVES